MTSRALKAEFLLAGCEAKLFWRPFLLLSQVLPQADLPKMAAFLRLRLKVYGIAIALCPQRKIPGEEKNHGNRKTHKIVKARLDSRCFSWTDGCSRCATFPLFALFFLFRFRIKFPSRG